MEMTHRLSKLSHFFHIIRSRNMAAFSCVGCLGGGDGPNSFFLLPKRRKNAKVSDPPGPRPLSCPPQSLPLKLPRSGAGVAQPHPPPDTVDPATGWKWHPRGAGAWSWAVPHGLDIGRTLAGGPLNASQALGTGGPAARGTIVDSHEAWCHRHHTDRPNGRPQKNTKRRRKNRAVEELLRGRPHQGTPTHTPPGRHTSLIRGGPGGRSLRTWTGWRDGVVCRGAGRGAAFPSEAK